MSQRSELPPGQRAELQRYGRVRPRLTDGQVSLLKAIFDQDSAAFSKALRQIDREGATFDPATRQALDIGLETGALRSKEG